MHNSFKKGLMVGGIIGASIGMMSNRKDAKRRMNHAGRGMFRKSSNLIANMVDLFR